MKNKKNHKNQFNCLIILCAAIFLINPSVALGEGVNFVVDSSYDAQGRGEVQSFLVLETNQLYFYVDNSLWQSMSQKEKDEAIGNFSALSSEFDNRIYPILTTNFGAEPKPGIDKDEKTTIIFHPLKRNVGGYFNSGNQYSRLEYPYSNEREMIYLNANYLDSTLLKNFLAHEFVHLITFNQKEVIHNIKEDVWLDEARAEYALTLLGYNDIYQGSNLQKRVVDFIKSPSNSLTSWKNTLSNYGVANLFIHYLVDHYGANILVDSLKNDSKGIESINYALAKNGYDEDFSKIFTDWTIAVLLNDCSLGEKYCFKNQNLENLRIFSFNDIVLSENQVVSVSASIDAWEGYWQKIIGGEGKLTIEFTGFTAQNHAIPYALCDLSDICHIRFLSFNEDNQGRIIIENFEKYPYLILIPSFGDVSSIIQTYNFSFRVKLENKNQDEEVINKLLSQIDYLKTEIVRLQNGGVVLSETKTSSTCGNITSNLYFGLRNNKEVVCLQEFLKGQGQEIYPEGLVTGNFLHFTQSAIIRFQEKYKQEILHPWDLEYGTGYVGEKTMTKINQLL